MTGGGTVNNVERDVELCRCLTRPLIDGLVISYIVELHHRTEMGGVGVPQLFSSSLCRTIKGR